MATERTLSYTGDLGMGNNKIFVLLTEVGNITADDAAK